MQELANAARACRAVGEQSDLVQLNEFLKQP